MISLPAGSRIWLVAGITDMRNGFCRYTTSQKYTVVRELSRGAGQVLLLNCWSRYMTSCASMC